MPESRAQAKIKWILSTGWEMTYRVSPKITASRQTTKKFSGSTKLLRLTTFSSLIWGNLTKPSAQASLLHLPLISII
jgi:hypothetical protein